MRLLQYVYMLPRLVGRHLDLARTLSTRAVIFEQLISSAKHKQEAPPRPA